MRCSPNSKTGSGEVVVFPVTWLEGFGASCIGRSWEGEVLEGILDNQGTKVEEFMRAIPYRIEVSGWEQKFLDLRARLSPRLMDGERETSFSCHSIQVQSQH